VSERAGTGADGSSLTPIRQVRGLSGPERDALAALLATVVEEGASVGFLPPLAMDRAAGYWERIAASDAVLFVAEIGGEIAGTIQIQQAESENGAHRAEICKLLVDPRFRRQGVGRALLAHAENAAAELGKTLLVLDTREGDPSNDLYRAAGWTEGGRIPAWARSATGDLAGTVFWYRLVEG
jgi:ribosomal protein S18 acetylase RimI-like enzyme